MSKGFFHKGASNLRRDPVKPIIILFLILTVFLVFGQTLQHDFINYDDYEYVVDNLHVQAGLTRESIIWAFTTTDIANWHPLTWLSHMLDCQLYGLNPRGHHLSSVLFHLVATVLLFLVLNRMTGAPWRSGFVASLFALHPLHVESVAWVAERKDVLSTFFWVLTMWTYVRYVERPGVKWYLLTLLAFGLGLMAKPMLVTLPFVLLLLDYWPLSRFQTGQLDDDTGLSRQPLKSFEKQSSLTFRLLWEKIPFFALAALSSSVTFLVQKGAGAVTSVDNIPISIRFANALVSYVGYIGKMLWPRGLAVFYPHPLSSLQVWQPVGAGLVLVAISIVVMRAARTHPYLPVGWLWYLGTLVPVIGLVQVGAQAMADRYTYVPLIGLFVIIAWGIPEVTARWGPRRIILGIAAGTLLPTLMICTWLQVQHWKNSLKLFEHALEVTADNYVAHNLLGAALANRGAFEEAVPHYYKALQISPQYAEAHRNLGGALSSLGMSEEAIAHYHMALQIQPKFAQAHNNLGEALTREGKLDEAITHFYAALRMRPNFAGAHNNLANALTAQGRLEEAIGHYGEAIRLRRDFADAHNNLAVALARQGRIEEAMAHYSQALRLKPDSAEAHNNLGVALTNLGRIQDAIAHYVRAVQLRSDYAEAYNNLGDVLARIGKLDEAKANFSRALEIRADYPEAHNNLGVTLARQGKLNEAIMQFREALRLKPDYVQAQANLDIALGEAGKTVAK